jgi:spermidine synthase
MGARAHRRRQAMAKRSRARQREPGTAAAPGSAAIDPQDRTRRAPLSSRARMRSPARRDHRRAPADLVVPALAAAFLASGAAGLMHEVVWTRLLGHLFGVSSFAISTVLAAYMGGLALGSWWIGTRTRRLRDTRRVYAWLELAIGACGLAVPFALDLAEPLYGAVWRRFHFSFGVFSALRFLIASAILIVPTALMGATLPVLADYFARRDGRRIAPQWLYTLNLVGAVAGVAIAGFVLMPGLGMWGTIVTAAAVNIAVAVGVLALPVAAADLPPAPGAAVETAEAPKRPRRAAPLPSAASALLSTPHVLLAAFVSGLVSLSTQVAWSRLLTLIVGSTTYAFTAVLLVYLVSLGAGSAIASRVDDRSRAGAALAGAYAASALLAVVAVQFVHALPTWYLGLFSIWGPEVPNGIVLRGIATAFAVMFPPIVCAGMVLPLALVAGRPEDARDTGAAVGRIYAVNTLGSIAGAILGGFVLVPTIGTRATILSMALVAAATALACALALPRPAWLRSATIAAALPVVFALLVGRPWDAARLHMGVFEAARHIGGPEGLRRRLESDRGDALGERLYAREGRSASVIVTQLGPVRGMKIDARANASDDVGDMATQVMLAQYPLLLAPEPKDVFIVGWGSGVTVGSALQFPGVESVTAVELEPAVVEASQHFRHVNHDPLSDPRTRLFEDDARHILLASEDTYDVIISEPPHPWVSGVANLFTRDFYEMAARRLREDGIFAQWVQSYQISFEMYQSILATFRSVFPEAIIFYVVNSYDTILIGSKTPLRLDLERLEARWRDPAVAADLARVGMVEPGYLLAGISMGPAGVAEITRGAPINTDDNMRVEFAASRGTTAEAGSVLWELESRATPIEDLLPEGKAFLGDHARLRGYVAGRVAMERGPGPHAALLGDEFVQPPPAEPPLTAAPATEPPPGAE